MEYKDVIVKVIEAQHQKIWSLEEVKNYLRVSHSYDDKLIGSLVETAVSAAENFTNLSLAIKHVELTCRLNGRGVAPLKHSPVIEITKVSMVEGQQQVELHK